MSQPELSECSCKMFKIVYIAILINHWFVQLGPEVVSQIAPYSLQYIGH